MWEQIEQGSGSGIGDNTGSGSAPLRTAPVCCEPARKNCVAEMRPSRVTRSDFSTVMGPDLGRGAPPCACGYVKLNQMCITAHYCHPGSLNMLIRIRRSLTCTQTLVPVALAAACLLSESRAKAGNLIANGSFETPSATSSGKIIEVFAGSEPATFDWKVNSGTVEITQQGYVDPAHQVFAGSRLSRISVARSRWYLSGNNLPVVRNNTGDFIRTQFCLRE